jgi:hypothetical protein
LSSSDLAAGTQHHTALHNSLKKIFSFPVALAGLLAVLAALSVRSRLNDLDLWWQLKIGQIIWQTRSIPLNDLFSFTANHHAVIPQEWLAQLSLFAAYQWGNLSGVMLWLCLFTAAVCLGGYLLCWLSSGNCKVAFLGAMLIWLFGTVGFAARPQMIGYLLLIAELLLVQLGRTRDARWFFGLPLVFALWINCHGSFMLGLILAGVFLGSSFFSFEFGSLKAQRWEPRRQKLLALALALSVPALFLNPVGLRQILYPFDTLLNMPVLLNNVSEWAPLNLTESRGIALLAVLLGIFLLAAARLSDLCLDELLLLALGTWLAVSHMRMLVFFGILAAPILCRQLSAYERYRPEEDRIWPNALLLTICALTIWMVFPGSRNLQEQVEAQSPVKAVRFIQTQHLAGPMLNDYPFGGYLIWAAPEHPVFIDGRTDLYEWAGVLGPYQNWITVSGDPRALLEKYKIRFCLLTPHSPMAQVMPLLPEWKQVYSDELSVIFVRNGSR